MAFKCARFKIDSWSGAGFASMQAWADDYLTKLKNAFIEASNGQWSLYSSIENIVGSDNVNYPKRTLQLYNSTTNKYLRFWCFGNERTVTGKTSPTASSGDTINIYRGNFYSFNDDGNSYRYGDPYGSGFYCGIRTGNPIDKDLGLRLQLDVPLFKVGDSSVYIESDTSFYVTRSYSDCEGFTSFTYSVVTDGDAFWIGRLTSNNNLNVSIYAPDLYICANSGDTNTAGVIVSKGGNNFYLGPNSDTDSELPSFFLTFMFSDGRTITDTASLEAAWSHANFRIKSSNNKKMINTVSTSSIMATSAVTVYLTPYRQSGSSGDAINNGVCLKGWVNPDYVRSVNVDHLTYAQRGITFGNGRWICVDAGVLLPWDISNTSSPFDPYVA